WPALAPLITAAPVSSLSTSSQLNIEILLPGTRKIGFCRLQGIEILRRVWSVNTDTAHYVVVICVCGHTIWCVTKQVNAQDVRSWVAAHRRLSYKTWVHWLPVEFQGNEKRTDPIRPAGRRAKHLRGA
ncbi:hypothetical protein, partial [Pseudomonas edaphica]|uniref:hypothetical protein n=1 Tax=Pseudomonas edaphica TaxID=2006980 RepID=UPI001C43061E